MDTITPPAGPTLAAAAATCGTLDRLWAERGGEARAAALQVTFDTAVRLETAFWDMGWREAGVPARLLQH